MAGVRPGCYAAPMTFATWAYRIAGLYGLVVITPLVFLERVVSAAAPPPITHPEYYYGFVVGAFAWQVVFLVIARDPVRFRPLMPVTWIEKSYGVFALGLYAQGRIAADVLALGVIDLVLAVLFVGAFLATSPRMRSVG